MNKIWLTAFTLLVSFSAFSQTDTTHVNKKRLKILSITIGTGYTATLIGLNELWYKNSDRTSFHFFNDNREWKQVDKIGHFYTGFYLSAGASTSLRWCNVQKKKADLWGSVTGFLVMVPVEIFDGFSSDYGASAGDLAANALGSGFYLAQSALWNEIRIQPKFSFHTTRYAALRPNTLGDNTLSEILKDYNGQTYWLSFDMDKFMKFPAWLNLAVGYGAHQMVYAHDSSNENAGYHAYRQYYLALDFDFTAIKTRSKALKTFLAVASMIKLPAPTLEFSSKGTRLYAFYF
jgi:hypothetical protein